ncbi:hypothetical protein [Sphingobacterium faecium]|uniref:hypothetical protein n=1 Tax=Sphingobacterium faecium TaxID=34087 RepID=UPI0024699575|nr:hypothetical protein [Sphingobacterium faecium]MDH5826676.1 hypothetical protein [Sphingobacterium faecium]
MFRKMVMSQVSVRSFLIFVVLVPVGKRSYFLKADVVALFDKTKGKVPYILGKLTHQVPLSLVTSFVLVITSCG